MQNSKNQPPKQQHFFFAFSFLTNFPREGCMLITSTTFSTYVRFCTNLDVSTCYTHGRVHVNVVSKHKRHLERGSVYVAADHRLNLVLLLSGTSETTPKLEQSPNHLTNPNNFCQSCHFRKTERVHDFITSPG